MNESDQTQEQMAALLWETAAAFPYPPTPDVATQVRRRLTAPPQRQQRRLAWALAGLLLVAGLLLAVPQVRAAVFEIIRAGAITIFVDEPTPTAGAPTPGSQSEAIIPPTATLPPLETAVAVFGELTTLTDAQAQTDFSLRLPSAYGPPDEVSLQDSRDGAIVILAWRHPTQPERTQLRLHQTRVIAYGLKQAAADAVAQTEINGQTAYWVEGGHRIRLQDGQSYTVTNNVLIWVEAGVTYRLEGELTLEEAVKVAASLESIQE